MRKEIKLNSGPQTLHSMIYKKILLIVFGVILSLAVLEAGLQTLSALLMVQQNNTNRILLNTAKEKQCLRVMCLGESTTYRAYPRFLEEALNSMRPEMHFVVIDRGHGGTEIKYIYEGLNNNLEEFNPDIVVTMMGINDDREELKVMGDISGRFYTRLKIYKLAELLKLHIKSRASELQDFLAGKNKIFAVNKDGKAQGGLELKRKKKNDRHSKTGGVDQGDIWAYMEIARFYAEQGNYRLAEIMYLKAVSADPKCSSALREMATIYKEQGNHEKEKEVYLRAINIDQEGYWAYLGMARLYKEQDKHKETEKMLLEAIEIDPGKDKAYLEGQDFYRELQKYDEAYVMYRKALENKQKTGIEISEILASIYADKGDALANKYYRPETQKYYQKIRDELKKRKILHVCVEYPTREVRPLINMLGQDQNLVFVGNERNFKDAVAKEGYAEYFTDRFAGNFGHCTDKGNRLLAKTIADSIIMQIPKHSD